MELNQTVSNDVTLGHQVPPTLYSELKHTKVQLPLESIGYTAWANLCALKGLGVLLVHAGLSPLPLQHFVTFLDNRPILLSIPGCGEALREGGVAGVKPRPLHWEYSGLTSRLVNVLGLILVSWRYLLFYVVNIMERVQSLQKKLTANKDSSHCGGQFEWVDGQLVEALKSGYWLLIDNVNFCR